MPLPFRILVLLAATCVVVAGCGDDRVSTTRPVGSDDEPETTTVAVRDDATPADAAPTAAAIAAGRRFDELASAFAPVSRRINFLVAAETLRQDAVDSSSDDDTELERSGAVRLEIRQMRAVLAAARPAVAAVEVDSPEQRRVRRLLLAAIDARARALGQLESVLDGRAAEVGDTIVDERTEQWTTSWDESLRATREATTVVQEARARLALDPAPEEALR